MQSWAPSLLNASVLCLFFKGLALLFFLFWLNVPGLPYVQQTAFSPKGYHHAKSQSKEIAVIF